MTTIPLSGTVEVRGEDLLDIAAALGGLAGMADRVYGGNDATSFLWNELITIRDQVLRLDPAYAPYDNDDVADALTEPERVKEDEAVVKFVRRLTGGLDEKGGV